MIKCIDCKFSGKHDCQSLLSSTKIYNAGYRKVDEGAVVLTREKYQDLQEYKNIAEQRKFNIDCANVKLRRLKFELKQTRKETAKEILLELDLFLKGTTLRKGYEFKKLNEKLKEIAEKYGVEVVE